MTRGFVASLFAVSVLASGLGRAQEAAAPPAADEASAQAVADLAPPAAQPAPSQPAAAQAPAPTRLFAGAKVFMEVEGQFGMALGASFIEKKVPLVVVADAQKADFIIRSTSDDRKGSTVGKIFGVSRDRYHATISIFNKDGILIFAYNVKKNTFQDAANSTANEIKNKGLRS